MPGRQPGVPLIASCHRTRTTGSPGVSDANRDARLMPFSLPVRILLVEDDPIDAELATDRLREDGIEFDSRLVEDEVGFREALKGFSPQLVLCDFNLPGFSGEAALRILREFDPLTPFIYLSGTMGEEAAIAALRGGATDYILKNQPTRLPTAVRRALNEAHEQVARRQAESELLRSQRFESLAMLAGSFSHDLRNVLQPVLMAARIVEEQGQQPELARYGTMIRECSERGLQMISAILDFARGGKRHAYERVDVAHLIDAIRLLLGSSLPQNITLVTAPVAAGLSLPGNSTELQQVLLNLGLNAVHAMSSGGTLSITVERTELDAAELAEAGRESAEPDGFVRIRVSDTGSGMDADTRAQLFQPFFTTKTGGTGLGLVSTQRIVENHGGFMHVDSRLGEGTTFDILLPFETVEAGMPKIESGCDGNEERILLVSDETATLTLLGDALGMCGYLPITAHGSVNALQTFRRVRNPAILVLDSDLAMLGAEQTLKTLREEGLSCPVLLLGDRPVPSATDLGFRLSKPVTVNSLLRAIRETLDRPASKPKG